MGGRQLNTPDEVAARKFGAIITIGVAAALIGIEVYFEAFVAGEGSRPTSVPITASNHTGGLLKYALGDGVFADGISAEDNDLRAIFEWNDFKNKIVLWGALDGILPRTAIMWVRNWFAGNLLYFGVGSVWIWYLYKHKRSKYFKDESEGPTWDAMWAQAKVSFFALPWYTLMPTLSDWLAERGYTRAYHSMDGYGGWGMYFVHHALYLLFVEFCIYWIHRILHWGVLYRVLHADHHKYNKHNTLSPFAGLAFNPIDGMLQASPYVVGLFLFPVHFHTHEAMLFATALWTTNIHDTLVAGTEPMMGSGYHTIHHTTYIDNYGQYFTLMDWLHGTLHVPETEEGSSKAVVGKGTTSRRRRNSTAIKQE
jgi:lathosterol oxidase